MILYFINCCLNLSFGNIIHSEDGGKPDTAVFF